MVQLFILDAMLGTRRRVLGTGLLGAGLLASVLAGACGDKKGSIMLAINTDMRAPKDVNAVSVTISANGQIVHSAIGRVTPQGEVELPATLAIAEGDDATKSIRIRVMAFQDKKARVLRDVRTSIPKGGRTALLRIPLNFVNDASAQGNDLPDGIVPDALPGTALPGTSSSSGGSVSAAGEFDFFNEFQPTCPDPIGQTVIDGECKDNFVDPETLPDFEAGQVGSSTDPGQCFDVARCFAGATALGEGSGDAQPRDGGASTDGGTSDKNFGIKAVTFDPTSCTAQLNGASADRLNLAILTSDTGECVRPGECYVPLDKGPSGWTVDGGTVRFPRFVCTLLQKKGLRLAQTTDVCAAKPEGSAICAAKPGEGLTTPDASVEGGSDGGSGGEAILVSPEDRPSAVAVVGKFLYFAGNARVAKMDLKAPPGTAATAVAIPGQPGSWRASAVRAGAFSFTNGSDKGFLIDPTGVPKTVSVAPNTIESAGLDADWIWAVSKGTPGVYKSGIVANNAVKENFMSQAPPDATALLTFDAGMTIVGEASGAIRNCTIGSESYCLTPVALGAGPVETIIQSHAVMHSGFALLPGGIYIFRVVAGGAIESMPVFTGDLSGVDAPGPIHHGRTLASVGSCVFFTSPQGLQYVRDGAPPVPTMLVPSAGRQIIGVTAGSEAGSDLVTALYFSVHAPVDQGGGIYKTPIPEVCRGGSGAPDAGGGADAAPPPCGPANCELGCCTAAGICMPGNENNNCGNFGNACINCTALGGQQCNLGSRMCYLP